MLADPIETVQEGRCSSGSYPGDRAAAKGVRTVRPHKAALGRLARDAPNARSGGPSCAAAFPTAHATRNGRSGGPSAAIASEFDFSKQAEKKTLAWFDSRLSGVVHCL